MSQREEEVANVIVSEALFKVWRVLRGFWEFGN